MEGEIVLKAKFKEQIELEKRRDGDWYNYLYRITYDSIEILKGKWEYPRISFLCKDTSPTEESGIKCKKLAWPFRENESLIFKINKDGGKNLIIGYHGENK